RRGVAVAREGRPGGPDRAVRIRWQAQLAEAHAQRVELQQAPAQRLADAQQQLDRLVGLQQADDARQHTQHAGLGAVGRELRRRRLREQAAIAWRLAALPARVEYAHLALEALHRAVYQRLAQLHAGIVEQVAKREIVRAVDHHVDAVQQRLDVVRGDPRLHRLDPDRGIERLQALPRRFHLGRADRGLGMQDLPLQVAAVDDVVVDQAQVPHSGRRQVERRRRAEPARADHQHVRSAHALLPLDPDLGQAQVARIALEEIRLLRLQLRPHQRQAFAGPGIGAAVYRVHTGEAGAAQGFRRRLGAPANLADQQHFRLRIGQVSARIRLKFGPAHRERALGLAGDAFVRLADVDQQHALPLAFAGLPRRHRYAVHAPDYRRPAPAAKARIGAATC